MYGDGFILDEYGDKLGTWLEYTAQNALLHHINIEELGLEVVGNSTLNYCKLNNCIYSTHNILHACTKINVRSSLTMHESKTIYSRIVSGDLVKQNPCKDVKLSIVGSIIDKYREFYNPGVVVFYVGPAAHIIVEVIDTFIDGKLLLISYRENNNISLFVHHSDITSSIDSTLKVSLEAEARNNSLLLQITNSNISNADWYGLSIEVPNDLLDEDVERLLDKGTVISVAIENCTFINNKVAVAFMVESIFNVRLEMIITNSAFHGNTNAT